MAWLAIQSTHAVLQNWSSFGISLQLVQLLAMELHLAKGQILKLEARSLVLARFLQWQKSGTVIRHHPCNVRMRKKCNYLVTCFLHPNLANDSFKRIKLEIAKEKNFLLSFICFEYWLHVTMDVPATGASLSGGARCAVSGIPTAFLIAGCFKTGMIKMANPQRNIFILLIMSCHCMTSTAPNSTVKRVARTLMTG